MLFVDEVYECIDCSYIDTSIYTFIQCFFCKELVCIECQHENKTNICNNCYNPGICFEQEEMICSLCQKKIFLQYENKIFCDACNHLICNGCTVLSNNNNINCIQCYEKELYYQLTNMKLN